MRLAVIPGGQEPRVVASAARGILGVRSQPVTASLNGDLLMPRGGGPSAAYPRPRGRVRVKVEPCPTSLSTDSSPPMPCASSRLIARPNPVPPWVCV